MKILTTIPERVLTNINYNPLQVRLLYCSHYLKAATDSAGTEGALLVQVNQHFLTIKHHKKMKVGSLVECVTVENWVTIALLGKNPKVGDTLTVRSIYLCLISGCDLLTFDEIINPVCVLDLLEYGYNIKNFRELQPPMDLTELLEETITELA